MTASELEAGNRVASRSGEGMGRLHGGRVVLVVLLWLALVHAAAALDVQRPLAQLHHTAWRVQDGAPGQITALAQTTDGYLWLATQIGLYRFDGVQFERYEPPAGEALPATSVSALHASPDGGLWVGFRYGAVSHIDGARLSHYGQAQGLPSGTVFSFARDAAVSAVVDALEATVLHRPVVGPMVFFDEAGVDCVLVGDSLGLVVQAGGFTFYGTLAAFMGWSPLPRLWMVLGIAALLVAYSPGATGWLAERVRAAGRAAFTNYLGTSVLMMFVFHGWALGLFGQLNRPQLYIVVALTCVLMLAWSKPWLDRYRYGPLEWLWRTGQLAITRRDGFRKVYDLTERVIPAAHRTDPPDEDTLIDWAWAFPVLLVLGLAIVAWKWIANLATTYELTAERLILHKGIIRCVPKINHILAGCPLIHIGNQQALKKIWMRRVGNNGAPYTACPCRVGGIGLTI